jgi:hypothetical protein
VNVSRFTSWPASGRWIFTNPKARPTSVLTAPTRISEFRVHRQWFEQSAMDVLLRQDFAVAEKDRLYRCLDRVLKHKQDLFVHLQQRWKDLFDAEFDLLLYDLTSTYVEGEAEQNPKAKYGYSRGGRAGL